jgi:hypothetical protein
VVCLPVALPKERPEAPYGDNRWPPCGGTELAFLQASLPDSGKLAPEGQLAEADAAHSDESNVSARPSAPFAPVVELGRVLHRARRKFKLLALPFLYFCFLSQIGFPKFLER